LSNSVSSREDFLSRYVINAAIEAHRTLGGPGLLEAVYEEALVWELRQKELDVERQKSVAIHYKGMTLGNPLVIDVLVEKLIIVECKATANYHPIFEAQLLTYLRITGLKLGFVINFGEKLVKDGIHRVVNNL